MNKTRIILPVAAAAFAACAGNPRPMLYDDAANEHVWPLPPEPTRISYVGQVASDRDLGKSQGFLDRLKAGILGAEEQGLLTKRPFDTAVDELGRVYVSNGALGALLVLDADHRDASILTPQGPGALAKPMGLDTDFAGRLYVADPVQRRVVALGYDGELLQAFGGRGILLHPVDVGVSPDGDRVYVVDSYLHQLVVFDRDGEVVTRIGRDEGPYDKDTAAGRSHGEGGLMESADPHAPGEPSDITQNRGALDGEFRFPSFIDVGPDGSVWVSDAVNFRVQGFDADGNHRITLGRHGDTPGSLARPKGVAVDSEGHVYIVDAAFNNVQIFDDTGRLLLAFGGVGTGPGRLWLPLGISIDLNDRIYIADRYNDRIQVFQYHELQGLVTDEGAQGEIEPAASSGEEG